MKGLGAYSAADYSLDDMLAVGAPVVFPEDLLLDEIPPQICGHANIAKLAEDLQKEGRAIVFTLAALAVISSLPVFLASVQPPGYCSGPPTSGRWTRHIVQLLVAGVFTAITVRREVKAVASYFGILKNTDPPTCRSIFNGRQFSSRCARPPSTNLPDISRVLEALAELCDAAPFATVVGDVRHMFHQVPVAPEVSCYFCLDLEDAASVETLAPPSVKLPEDWCGMLRIRTLPMGWSFSPWVAQCLGFGLLITALEKAGVSGLEAWKRTRGPPPLIKLYRPDAAGRERLFLVCVLWYDNLLICCTDNALALSIHRTVRETFDDDYSLKLKELAFFGASSLRRGCAKKPSYLNIEFRTCCFRGPDDKPKYRLEWCPLKKKRDKWQQCVDVVTDRMTARSISKVVGTILWVHHVRGTPLCRLSCIDLVRKAASAARSGSWASVVTLTAVEVQLLRDELQEACAEEWASSRIAPEGTPIYIACDSSSKRWAFLTWLSPHSAVSRALSDASNWSASIVESSIFLKELTCVTIAVERVSASYPGSHLVVFCDNTAACHVVRRLASSTHGGTELALRIDIALRKHNCTLEIIHVASEQNPADTNSRTRRFTVVESRVEAMWTVWSEYKYGRTSEVNMSMYGRSWSVRTGEAAAIRHAEQDHADANDDLTEGEVSDSDEMEDDFEEFVPSEDETV